MNIILAFIKKEFLQIIKDPSSLIIAFILPLVLLAIYTYGLNFDDTNLRIGIKNENVNQETNTLIKSFSQNTYITADIYTDRPTLFDDLVRSRIKAALIIPNDFINKLASGQTATLSLITDGAEMNQVAFAQSYANAIVRNWLNEIKYNSLSTKPKVSVESRFWYNQSVTGIWSIVPGSLAVTMTLIGILLTALVIAREWERGTMETLLTTRIKPIHIVIGKYVPYFIIGMLSLLLNIAIMVFVLDIPFRGNFLILCFISALFLYACLGIGLIISTLLKNQFLASMAALIAGFLPALMLSGLIFPIKSMPLAFQYLTMILPPRYYVTFIRTEFLSGTDWQTTGHAALYLFLLGFLFSLLVYRKTARRL